MKLVIFVPNCFKKKAFYFNFEQRLHFLARLRKFGNLSAAAHSDGVLRVMFGVAELQEEWEEMIGEKNRAESAEEIERGCETKRQRRQDRVLIFDNIQFSIGKTMKPPRNRRT